MSGRVLAATTSWRGLHERRDALASVGIHVPVDEVTGPEPTADALDDATAAWTATRVAAGRVRRYPSDAASGEPSIVA